MRRAQTLTRSCRDALRWDSSRIQSHRHAGQTHCSSLPSSQSSQPEKLRNLYGQLRYFRPFLPSSFYDPLPLSFSTLSSSSFNSCPSPFPTPYLPSLLSVSSPCPHSRPSPSLSPLLPPLNTLSPSPSSRHIHAPTHAMHATTVVCVRKGNVVVIMADGQVTLGSQIVKPNVKKVRRLGHDKSVIAGFAGAAADGITLFERLEARIDEYPGQLSRACVELAKAWRTDKYLRRLDAVMVVADATVSLMVSGNGDILEPHDGVLGIGAGGTYALAAARALKDIPGFDAEEIAKRAMAIAAESCIYTNSNFTVEKIVGKEEESLPS